VLWGARRQSEGTKMPVNSRGGTHGHYPLPLRRRML
jgi:hypothetical protein